MGRRCWIVTLLAVVLLWGCAGPKQTGKSSKQDSRTAKSARPPRQNPTGFASADAKNVHDFLLRFQKTIAGGDEKAIARLYVDDARVVPYLVENKRVLTRKEFESRLPHITKLQRRAEMSLAFREPMDIKVSVSGERADVQVLADLVWQEGGKGRHQLLDCYFRLDRENYVWKIRQSHQDVAAPGQSSPGKGAAPAIQSGPADNRDADTPQTPLVPADGESPQPLF